jgi:aryl-alcohol dehydrogenase-like predicted oxidoreductase
VKYARLGQSGLYVSRFAFGVMVFGDKGLFPITRVGQAAADRLVAAALDAGVNFFDTANVYCFGQSEEMLGKALGKKRRDVIVSSKVGNAMSSAMTDTGLSRRHILASVDASLGRLGTDYLDILFAHRFDPLTPLEETLEAFDACVRAGKVRYIGFSNWSAWQAAKALEMQRANNWARFVVGQMYYSLVGREVEQEVAPFMEHEGLGMMVWSPVVRGFLAGRYDRESWARSGMAAIYSFDVERGLAVVDVLKRVAQRQNSDCASVALAWLLTRQSVSTLVFGATDENHLASNLKGVDLALSAEDLAELDEVSALAPAYPAALTQKMLANDARRAAIPGSMRR